MILEVCCNSIASAQAAEAAGAHRIEFCTGLALGGLTPSWGMLEAYKEVISTPTRVLIRPREGDFTYSAQEFKGILKDITHCKTLGFQGVVSGVLTAKNTLDLERTKELVAVAGGENFTFHRAFDWLSKPLEALDQLAAMGINTLLTSGGAPKAIEGLSLLSELLAQNTGVTIMPGSGIQPSNASAFKERGFKALHLSGVAAVPFLEQQPPVSMNSPAMCLDTHRFITQQQTIEELLGLLRE